MALILKLLKEKKDASAKQDGEYAPDLLCKNPNCITRTERGIKLLFKGNVCAYCDQKATKK